MKRKYIIINVDFMISYINYYSKDLEYIAFINLE
jgi:hypothetical protein